MKPASPQPSGAAPPLRAGRRAAQGKTLDDTHAG